MMTIERRKLMLDRPGGLIMWVVQGDGGAVSLTTWETIMPQEPDGRMAGAVALHYLPTAAPVDRVASPCELLPGGVCKGDGSHVAGRELYDLYRSSGQADEVIYGELEEWYRDRMGES